MNVFAVFWHIVLWLMWLVFGLCVAVVIQIVIDLRWKMKKLPPGPWGLPIIGSVFWLGTRPHISLTKMSKTYGDVMSITFGSYTAIVLNSIESVRETFGQRSGVYAGRPQLYSLTEVHEGLGVLFINFGEKYQRQRKLVIRSLHRTFYMDNKVHDLLSKETAKLVDKFAKYKHEQFDPQPLIRLLSVTVTLNSFFALNCTSNSDIPKRVVANVDTFENTANPINLSDIVPWLQKLPFTTNYAKIKEIFHEFIGVHTMLYTQTKESRTVGAPRNLTDALLDNLDKYNKDASDEASTVNEKDLIYVLADLVAAAFDTVACTLSWAFMYIAAHPNWQTAVQSELDDIIGRDRMPSLHDRPNLPITNATLHEVLRISPALPLTLPHSTTHSSRLRDFIIPEGTFVFVNLWAIHHDPSKWSAPDEFNPRRFLNESGQFVLPGHGSFLPFSTGRRSCMGDRMAKDEIFIVFATTLHRLRLRLASTNIDSNGEFTLTFKPKPYLIRTEER